MTIPATKFWPGLLAASLLASMACMYTETDRRYQRMRALPEGVIEYEDTLQNSSELELDERVWETIEDITSDGSDSPEEGDGDKPVSSTPPGEEDDNDDHADERDESAPAPSRPSSGREVLDDAAPAVDSITLQWMKITINALKTSIDDTDELYFRLDFNFDIAPEAARIILQTFEHAALPNPRVLSYGGPAPEGFDLAALIGVLSVETSPRQQDITFESPGDEAWWDDTAVLLTEISKTAGTVSVDGVVVLQLSDRAYALDALGPA